MTADLRRIISDGNRQLAAGIVKKGWDNEKSDFGRTKNHTSV